MHKVIEATEELLDVMLMLTVSYRSSYILIRNSCFERKKKHFSGVNEVLTRREIQFFTEKTILKFANDTA